MNPKNVEMLVRENEELSDLLEDLMTRIQEIREEMTAELDDLEDMISEAREAKRRFVKKVHV